MGRILVPQSRQSTPHFSPKWEEAERRPPANDGLDSFRGLDRRASRPWFFVCPLGGFSTTSHDLEAGGDPTTGHREPTARATAVCELTDDGIGEGDCDVSNVVSLAKGAGSLARAFGESSGPVAVGAPATPAHLPLFRSGISVPVWVPKFCLILLALSLLTSDMSISHCRGSMLGPLQPVDPPPNNYNGFHLFAHSAVLAPASVSKLMRRRLPRRPGAVVKHRQHRGQAYGKPLTESPRRRAGQLLPRFRKHRGPFASVDLPSLFSPLGYF